MTNWPRVPLGEVVRHRKEFITIDDAAQYRRCRVQTSARGVVLRDIVSGADIKTKTQQVCRTGEFLVAEIDAKVGGYGLVPPDLEGAVVSSHYFLFAPNEAKIDRHFLDWYAKTAEFAVQVQAAGSTNYAAVRPGQVLEYTVPLPPLAEQRSIVNRLDRAAAAVEKIQKLRVATLRDLAALIVRANECYSAQPCQLGNALALDEDRVPLVPDTSYPQIGIRGFGGGLFRKAGVTAEETTYRHFNRLGAGHFVVSQVKGWEGAVAVCDSEHAGLFASPEYRTFRCVPQVLRPTYFSYLCRTPWFHAKLAPATRGQGARRERLRPEMLQAISIPLPSVETQEALEAVFARVERAAVLSNAGDLDQLLPSMLNEVFG